MAELAQSNGGRGVLELAQSDAAWQTTQPKTKQPGDRQNNTYNKGETAPVRAPEFL
jgi:hypothetical protein